MKSSSLKLQELDLEQLKLLALEADVFLLKHNIKGEEYTKIYKKNPELFSKLIRKTANLKHRMREFFEAQYKRLPFLVYLHKLQGDEMDDDFDESDFTDEDTWAEEDNKLSTVLIPLLLALFLYGVNSIENETGYTSNHAIDTTSAMKAVHDYSSKLAGDLNETTKNMILEIVKNGLSTGQSKGDVVSRLDDILNNDSRAEMIARTESVRMWSQGRADVADEMGLTRLEWQAGPGACELCSELDGQVIDVSNGEDFGDGVTDAPLHPNCLCSTHWLGKND